MYRPQRSQTRMTLSYTTLTDVNSEDVSSSQEILSSSAARGRPRARSLSSRRFESGKQRKPCGVAARRRPPDGYPRVNHDVVQTGMDDLRTIFRSGVSDAVLATVDAESGLARSRLRRARQRRPPLGAMRRRSGSPRRRLQGRGALAICGGSVELAT